MSTSDDLTTKIAAAVASRLAGPQSARSAEIAALVAEELRGVLAPAPAAPIETSRLVVTAHGRNRSGIVARLAAVIDQHDGDIRDLSQTIVGDYFTMLFVVDVPHAATDGGPGGARFAQLRQALQTMAADLGVHVVVMHDDILSAMHSI
jgi:ACT domain-containing protein